MLIRIAALVIACLCSIAAGAQATPRLFHQTHAAMGTEFSIDLYARDETTADEVMGAAFDEVDRLEALLSNYRPSSELSRISREAGEGDVITDPETFQFLERSLHWSRASHGAFDITVGPLLRAWGFFFHSGRIPSGAELLALRDKIGWQKISLNPQTRAVAFRNHRQMEFDPGSIGKGFAVDRVVAVLHAQGITSAFISAGASTLYGLGTPPGQAGWPVHVPDPEHHGRIASTVMLKDVALSTGACTEKFFIKDGHRYCHIFDPHTMRPVEGMLQTSVIDPSATDSDALSTVVFVLTPDESSRLLSSMPRTKALIFRQPLSAPACIAINWQGDPCGKSGFAHPRSLQP